MKAIKENNIPVLIQVGNHEILKDDSIIFYQLNKKYGNVRLELYSEMVHNFQFFYDFHDLSLLALKNIKKFIESTKSTRMEAVEYSQINGVFYETVQNDPYTIVEEEYKDLEKLKIKVPDLESFLPEVVKCFQQGNEKLRKVCRSS